MSDLARPIRLQMNTTCSTDLVGEPYQVGKTVRTNPRHSEMHMVLDGSSLLVRQAKPADVAEDADGPPAMPMDAHGIVVMGRAYVMQQRPEDDAVAGQPTAVGERKLARFQRVLCKAPRHVMMGVAADSEKVALAKIVDDTLNALAVCAAQ